MMGAVFNVAFNDYVDEAFGPLGIFEVEFRASEVLFKMEPETYRIYLTEFQDGRTDSASDPEMLEVTP